MKAAIVEQQHQREINAVKECWRELTYAETERDAAGLEFGKACYNLRKKAEVVQGGTTFRATLEEFKIAKSTAYFWIDRYEKSAGVNKVAKRKRPTAADIPTLTKVVEAEPNITTRTLLCRIDGDIRDVEPLAKILRNSGGFEEQQDHSGTSHYSRWTIKTKPGQTCSGETTREGYTMDFLGAPLEEAKQILTHPRAHGSELAIQKMPIRGAVLLEWVEFEDNRDLLTTVRDAIEKRLQEKDLGDLSTVTQETRTAFEAMVEQFSKIKALPPQRN